jgi:hypothetical protein
METEIVDHNLQIVSGTGRFRQKIGAYEEGGDANSPLVYGKVLRSGIDYICLDAPNDPMYQPEEQELAEICCPILVGSEVAGLIGLVAFTPDQQEKMAARANIYLNFLREMSMLISGKLVWELMNAFAPKMPKRAMIAQQQKLRKIAFPAARHALLESLRPRARETIVLTPTPVPVPRPIIIFCAGKARDKAERQSSDTFAT